MLIMKEFVLSFKQRNNTIMILLLFNCLQVLTLFNDCPVTRLYDRVQLSIFFKTDIISKVHGTMV